MDKPESPIRVPRNQTALMQSMQRLISCGHHFWTHDQIAPDKLSRLIAKWQPQFQLRADPAGRAYRKRTGLASVHLLVAPNLLGVGGCTGSELGAETGATAIPRERPDRPSGSQPKPSLDASQKRAWDAGMEGAWKLPATHPLAVDWWMLSTAGEQGLAPGMGRARTGGKPSASLPGRVFDGRTQEGRLRLGDFELLQQAKTFTEQGKTRTLTTWTWRLRGERYRQWEALLVEHARQGDRAAVGRVLAVLQEMPMFAGLRAQLRQLGWEANRVLRKLKAAPVTEPQLPTMRMIKLWAEDFWL